MLNRLKPKSEFSRNVLTLMTGTTIAQAIPIAISPILTRIYTPEDFGVFALYMSVASIFSVVATGQYELAIMLPSKKEDAINIVALSVYSTIVVSLIAFFIVFFFNYQIANLLGNKDIALFLYLVPVSIFLTGIYNTLNYWLNRNKSYKALSTSKVYQSLTVSTSNISFGMMNFQSLGLVFGGLLGQLVSLYTLIKKIDIKNLKTNINHLKMIALAKKYKKFPKITLPHAIFNSASTSLPIFIFTHYFSSKEAGYFSFASKIVMLPIGLISSAYFQVFFESFSKEKNKEVFFKQKFKQVNLIFLPIFIILWFIFPALFSFVFGENWRIAGEYSQILLPLFYLKFLSNLFTTTTYIYYEKQSENFMLGILITLLILCSLLSGAYYQNITLGLVLMSISNSMVVFYKIYRSFQFVKQKKEN